MAAECMGVMPSEESRMVGMWLQYAAATQNVGVWLHYPPTLETRLALGTPGSSWEGLGAREPRQGQSREGWVPEDLARFSEAPVHSSRSELEEVPLVLPFPFNFLSKMLLHLSGPHLPCLMRRLS